jgi:hypothetical protein
MIMAILLGGCGSDFYVLDSFEILRQVEVDGNTRFYFRIPHDPLYHCPGYAVVEEMPNRIVIRLIRSSVRDSVDVDPQHQVRFEQNVGVYFEVPNPQMKEIQFWEPE